MTFPPPDQLDRRLFPRRGWGREPDDGRRLTRRHSSVDAAMLHVVRLVLDDTWTAAAAAARLRARVPDDAVLHRARVRARRAVLDRPTPIALRAAVTLDTALGADGIRAE